MTTVVYGISTLTFWSQRTLRENCLRQRKTSEFAPLSENFGIKEILVKSNYCLKGKNHQHEENEHF